MRANIKLKIIPRLNSNESSQKSKHARRRAKADDF